MRLIKKSMAFALVAAMVVTMAPADMADAAKKVKLNKKTASIEVGQTVKIKVKNAKKSAKVTWKSSKKKVANIKKSTKKGNAYANVVGLKAGKSKITATYKVGKKKAQKLTCTVTVTDQVAPTPSGTPVVSASPTAPAQPTQNVPTPTPAPTPTRTPRPTATPTPVPTPTPTPLPVKDYNFAEVKNGIPIDVSTYSGSGKYNNETKRLEINDPDGAESMGSWELPESIKIKDDDLVTFRVQGFNYGTSGFRFWIGGNIHGGCTPVIFRNEIDEEKKIGECGYPRVVDENNNELQKSIIQTDAQGKPVLDQDGNPQYIANPNVDWDAATNKTMNQMALSPDETTKAFDVTVTFKAGTSQNDNNGKYTHLTLKYIMEDANTINGLCIKNIYYITGEEPSVTDEPGTTDAPTTTDEPTTTAEPGQLDLSTMQSMDGTPTGVYDEETGTVKILNDEANSRYLFELPEGLSVAEGDKLNVTVNGDFADENNGFRVIMVTTDGSGWDRSDQGRYEPEEEKKIGPVDYTCTLTMKAVGDNEKVYLAIVHKQAPIKNLTINKIVVTKETADEAPDAGAES